MRSSAQLSHTKCALKAYWQKNYQELPTALPVPPPSDKI